MISDENEGLKRGAGSQNNSKVLVMTESIVVESPRPGKKPKKINHIKMEVVPDLRAGTAVGIVKDQILKGRVDYR